MDLIWKVASVCVHATAAVNGFSGPFLAATLAVSMIPCQHPAVSPLAISALYISTIATAPRPEHAFIGALLSLAY